MKKNITKILLTAFSAAFMAVNLSSCTKSDSTDTGSITEADAAQVTTDAVTPSTGGVVGQVSSAAGLFSNATVTGGTVSVINNRPRAWEYHTLRVGKRLYYNLRQRRRRCPFF